MVSHKRGAALMVVLGLSVIIAVVLHRTLFVSQMEYMASRHTIDELRARYNARSGAELNLLRIRIFKEIQLALGGGTDQEALFRPYVDFIWRWPVVWPLPLPENATESDRQVLKKVKGESFLNGSYFADISPEDGKMDLNALSAPLDYLRNFTTDSLVNFLLNEAEKRGLELETDEIIKVLFNLADWMDKDNDSRNGGSEETIAPDTPPLNRSFLFVEEIRNVPEMTEEIYRILKPQVSVYGSQGLNINYAAKPLLRAIGISEGLAELVLLRTQPNSSEYRPFSKVSEFCDFLSDQGEDVCLFLKEKYGTLGMLKINTPLHLLIQSQGGFQRASSQVEALIYDANLGLRSYKESMKIHNALIKGEADNSSALPPFERSGERNAKNQTPAKKKERMKYQSFSPIFIMYWKED